MTIPNAISVQKHEWQQLDDTAPIRQGDILVLRHPRTLEVQDRVLVITADCDIAKSKTSGGLAALRVLPLETYVRHHWAGKHTKRLFTIERAEVINSFNTLYLAARGGTKTLSESALTSWVSRLSGEQICAELKVTDEKIQKKITSCVAKLAALLAIEIAVGTDECFDKICAFYAIKDNQQCSEAKTTVLKKVRAELASLPEDIFLLSSFPDTAAQPYVVMLRQLVALTTEQVTTSAEQARANHSYLRYGRLAPTFKYAISQQFGLLYSRIGLPNEYDEHKKHVAESFSC